jgi:3-oxoacyl-[acyl-carrier protein] reductase
VTGAGRGIGQATALALAGAGAKVLVSDRLSEGESRTVGMIKGAGGEAQFWQADISQKDQVEGLITAALNFGGRIDILVNNAGILRVSFFIELQERDWDDVIAVNLKGTFLCSQIAARQMIKKTGGALLTLGRLWERSRDGTT